MSTDKDAAPDPFAAFEGDRTVIKPSAGRGTRPAGAAPSGTSATAGPGMAAVAPPVPGRHPDAALPELPPGASFNPLVQAAAPLLSAAPRLRAMVRHPNPAALRASLIDSVQRFEAQARAQGLPNDQVVAARYVLCTLVDEAASSTPWGGSGAWSGQSLLVHFHNETWGGEKVFQLLTRLAENPAQHRNLLELVYSALALGFEGRYRVLDNGKAQLDSLRERLAAKLRELAGPVDRALSIQWQGAPTPAVRLRDGIPLWVIGSALALVLLLLFVVLRLTLNAQTDAAFASLQTLDATAAVAPPPVVAAPATPPAPPPPRLAAFLEPEIKAGLVEVRDLADRSVITIRGDGLFAPGSADVAARVLPLMDRIATALSEVQGAVIVTGHSDNVPIRSLRFPSNWHLSNERAISVKNLMTARVQPGRLRAEGRAEAEPVADNATPEGRARNRRVEITLLAAASAS